jgi:hypothetical protein
LIELLVIIAIIAGKEDKFLSVYSHILR